MNYKIFNNTILAMIFLLAINMTSIVLAKDVNKADQQLQQESQSQSNGSTDQTKDKETFVRERHPCENTPARNDPTYKGGVLQYDIDCAPFHQTEILDLTGKSKWSIVSWINRIITFFYQMALVAAVLGVLVAGVKYIKAGGEGGFAAAKDALKFALIGFLVAGTAWTLVAMWSRAMSMLA